MQDAVRSGLGSGEVSYGGLRVGQLLQCRRVARAHEYGAQLESGRQGENGVPHMRKECGQALSICLPLIQKALHKQPPSELAVLRLCVVFD